MNQWISQRSNGAALDDNEVLPTTDVENNVRAK